MVVSNRTLPTSRGPLFSGGWKISHGFFSTRKQSCCFWGVWTWTLGKSKSWYFVCGWGAEKTPWGWTGWMEGWMVFPTWRMGSQDLDTGLGLEGVPRCPTERGRKPTIGELTTYYLHKYVCVCVVFFRRSSDDFHLVNGPTFQGLEGWCNNVLFQSHPLSNGLFVRWGCW